MILFSDYLCILPGKPAPDKREQYERIGLVVGV